MFSRLTALLFLLLGATGLWAQGPAGSYQQSCNNISVDRDTLHATCNDGNGHWLNTTLNDIDTCRGDISNQNGTLTCAREERSHWQDRDRDRDDDDRDYQGSFTQSCRNISRHGNTLRANCQATDGSWHDTELRHANKCSGDIMNDNGQLRCNYGGGGPSYNSLPGGTYTKTCRNARMDGGYLKAQCQDGHGNWRDTSLRAANSCSGEIENNNGNLVCYTSGGVPGGTYQQSCTNIEVSGTTLKAKCTEGNGHHRTTELRNFQSCTGDIANMNGYLTCH